MTPEHFQQWMDLQTQQLHAMNRIADALEKLAQDDPNAPKPPKFIRSITEFPNFDWGAINATVMKSDRFGAAIVQYEGKEYGRKSKDEDIWFNRKVSQMQDANGQTKPVYEVLIRFGRTAKVKSIPEEIQELYSNGHRG